MMPHSLPSFSPQPLVRTPEPFNDPAWLWQLKLDGFRALAYIENRQVDKRQLYRDAGCSSLYTFCTDGLGLSESEAYLRMEAARAARRFPLILERLADGSVTLTAVSMLRSI